MNSSPVLTRLVVFYVSTLKILKSFSKNLTVILNQIALEFKESNCKTKLS